jgi:hypothetical protein
VLDTQPEININFTVDEQKYISFIAANLPDTDVWQLTLNKDIQQDTSPER